MGAFFTSLLSKLTAIVGWVKDLFVQIFKDAWEIITDAFCWFFDQILDVAVLAINSLDLSGLLPYAGNMWSGVSGEVLNVLGLIGMGTALSIIAAAAVIRIALQTIPFVRWGS